VLDFGVTNIFAVCRDGDADGACDPCPAGTTIANAKLALGKLDTPAGDDTLSFKGELTVPTAPAIDPVATGVRLLLEDDAGTVVDAVIPGGAFDDDSDTGWKAKNGTFKYKNGADGIRGITKITVKVSKKVPGLVRFVVKGKGGSYAVDPASPAPLRATVAFDVGAGQCGDAAPACVAKPKAGKVQCK
jgi:hypothetical protein